MALSVAILLISICGVLSSDVLELTDSSFDDDVKGDIILVEFFAPWCGHCKKLAPEYEIAATALLKNDPPVKLAKVDCVGEGKESCSKYGVSGYPTLKVFRNGAFSEEYDGPRDSAGIISHMKKNAGPSSVELKDLFHLESKLDSADGVTVVGFFSKDSLVLKKFLQAADQRRSEISFAHTSDVAISEKFGHKDEVVLFRPKHMHAKFEDPKVVINSVSDTKDIVTFIDKNHLGLVGQLTNDNEGKFTKPLVVAYYDIDWNKNPKGSGYWRNRVARVAKKFIGSVSFGVASRSDFTSKMTDLGFENLDGNTDPFVVGYDADGLKYKMSTDFSVDNLEKFTNQFKSNELKAYIKSEPVPEDNNGPVKVVVGENFNEIVNDPEKDVLIEFYAPWCGHCKSLEPKYTELGEKFSSVDHIVIAKMDATANDVPPQYSVSGFPTIYWAPAGSKQSPKKYESGREVDDFVSFIKKESMKTFTLKEKKKKSKKTKEKSEL